MKRWTLPLAALLTAAMLLFLVSPVFANTIKLIVDGTYVQSDVAPLLVNNRALVPIRVVSERLGAHVDWDPNTSTATIQSGNRVIYLTAGSSTADIDGKTVYLDPPPQLMEGRLMVPLRFISESLGKNVYYDATFLDEPTVWVSTENLLSLDDVNVNDGNYIEYTEEASGLPYYVMKSEGMTKRGIRIGDPISTVKERYGIPQRDTFDSSTKKNIVEYTTLFLPQSGYSYWLVFEHQNGTVERVVVYPPN
ncbi:copper amine oxidase N-terminal domain-containing protein [Heliobacterium mobile]|nr:copper amine oxidase N-terminal domain-containing protein [Heliobacterium mobile]